MRRRKLSSICKASTRSENLTPTSIDAVCESFVGSLKNIGKFTLKFMMRDEMNIRDNAFFFCGRNSKGFEKIKEAMWRVDPENGNSFSAHREAREQVFGSLFEPGAQTGRLGSLILDHFKGQKDVSVKTVFDWVIDDTDVFLPTHARRELETLLSRKKIIYTDPAGSARKRRANDWPERLLVTFEAR
jgi:hypothetical protein